LEGGVFFIQHKASSVQEVEEIPVPVPDNEGTLEDIWYGMVGAILSYLMTQGRELFLKHQPLLQKCIYHSSKNNYHV
jgi:hypothetical protein